MTTHNLALDIPALFSAGGPGGWSDKYAAAFQRIDDASTLFVPLTDGSDLSVAVQAALDTLAVSANPWTQPNPIIELPEGAFTLSSTLAPPAAASNFEIRGQGRKRTKITWTGGNAPMIKLDSPWNAKIKGLALIGNATAGNCPTYGIQVHRSAAWTGSGRPAQVVGEDLIIGGDSTDMMTIGIGYTALDATRDANNDTGTFRDVFISHVGTGYRFPHKNTLWHIIDGGMVEYSSAYAIDNTPGLYTDGSGPPSTGGSFKCFGTNFGSNQCTLHYQASQALHDTCALIGCNGENEYSLLETPANIDCSLRFTNCGFHVRDPATSPTGYSILSKATDGRLEFHGTTIDSAGSAGKLRFEGAVNHKVNFFGGEYSVALIEYACPINFHDTNARTAATMTNLGSGKLSDNGIYYGTGSPEGIVAASRGRLYVDQSGGASTTLYVKTSGASTANTGWTAK